jgi:hypothetical protein
MNKSKLMSIGNINGLMMFISDAKLSNSILYGVYGNNVIAVGHLLEHHVAPGQNRNPITLY